MLANLQGQLGEPMRIDEVTNPLGAVGALAGGVASQLGRMAVKKFTGKDLEDFTDQTPDLFQLLMQQPKLLYTPQVQDMIKKGLLTPEQVQQIQAQLNKQKDQTSAQQPAQPADPMDSPDVGVSNIPQGQRLKVQNPQKTATFYKHSDGRWYNENNQLMPQNDWAILDTYADAGGVMEKIPTATNFKGFKQRLAGQRTRGASA